MRRLAHAVIAVLAGAALALYAATRTWSVRLTERPGLSDLRAEDTGAAEMPWLPALALVALAGAGALLATRGPVRRALGVLLVAVGAGLVVSAIVARAGLDPGAAGAAAMLWPAACVLGGGLVGLGGLGAVRHGQRWPAMGSRYERRPAPPSRSGSVSGSGSSPGVGPLGGDGSTPAAGSLAEPSPAAESLAGSSSAAGSSPVRGSLAGSGPLSADAGSIAGSTGRGDDAAGEASGSSSDGRDDQLVEVPVDTSEEPVDTRAVWDALDRGEDPTAR
jgi:hypothetical protein